MILVNFLTLPTRKVAGIAFASVCILIFNEVFVYYLVIGQCFWPKLLEDHSHNSTEGSRSRTEKNASANLRTMFLADPHLLGPRRGHWFDKLRREWQMYRAFQTATMIFNPDVVFILGDVFDEGLWVTSEEFQEYVNRFRSIFAVSTQLFVAVGNHDIGFHYVITPTLNKRFEKAFNSTSVQAVKLNGVLFVLINSMAMQRDGCFLCADAVKKLRSLEDELDCQRNSSSSSKCNLLKAGEYSQPILLQHFPLFRESDSMCSGDDISDHKDERFREDWDCVSKPSSQLILRSLRPRLVMSGHTHHGCLHHHKYRDGLGLVNVVPEYSVPSFSWRNRDNPSFYLGVFSRTDFGLKKCQMPRETTVKLIYLIWIGGLCAYVLLNLFMLTFGRIFAGR